MKGWVYVITNPAMPGLVKIGFSRKDPDLRAEELDNTGTPHKYRVEYDVLVENPEQYERLAHCEFEKNREGKEWFRATPEEAVAIIKKVVKKEEILLESFKCVDRQKAAKIHQLRLSGERGDASAQMEMGLAYMVGWAVKMDYKETIKWFLMAANQGVVEAQRRLGTLYLNGKLIGDDETSDGFSQNVNVEESIKWLTIALNNGDIESARTLGEIFSGRNEIKECEKFHDMEKAIKYYKIAAEKGDSISIKTLGLIYEDKKDVQEALKWQWMAVNNGDLAVTAFLAMKYLYLSDYLTDQKTKSSCLETGLSLLQKAADSGYPEAIYQLGIIHMEGKKVPKDIKKARYLFSEANKKGVKKAAELLRKIS